MLLRPPSVPLWTVENICSTNSSTEEWLLEEEHGVLVDFGTRAAVGVFLRAVMPLGASFLRVLAKLVSHPKFKVASKTNLLMYATPKVRKSCTAEEKED